jgi:hypothetical protein
VFTIGVEDLRWCETNPVSQVTLPPASKGRTRDLSDAKREALLVSCQASEAPALYALVLMAVTTGARRGELYGLRCATSTSRASFRRQRTATRGACPSCQRSSLQSRRYRAMPMSCSPKTWGAHGIWLRVAACVVGL